MAEIKYEIQQTVGTISQSPKGWNKELNLISWNGKAPKYDLRDWAPDLYENGQGSNTDYRRIKGAARFVK